MRPSILIVEDDADTAESLRAYFSLQGYRVSLKHHGGEALRAVRETLPDAVITDFHVPGLSGLKLSQMLRCDPETAHIPIIMLTVSAGLGEKVRGLRSGADDYVTKPFSFDELEARVDALLRRSSGPQRAGRELRAGVLAVDLDRREATLSGKRVVLRRKEYELLVLLIKQPGRVVGKDFLIESLWSETEDVTSNALNSHVKNLRQKLGRHRSLVETVIGEGYRLKAP